MNRKLNRQDICTLLAADYRNRYALDEIAASYGLISDGIALITPLVLLIGTTREFKMFCKAHEKDTLSHINAVYADQLPGRKTIDWTDELLIKLQMLYNSGLSIKSVAAEVGISASSVFYALRKMKKDGYEIRIPY